MGAHPLDIRVADGGAQVTTGAVLTGAGVAGTVTWVTTGVAAATLITISALAKTWLVKSLLQIRVNRLLLSIR